jgi:hypothetical protein
MAFISLGEALDRVLEKLAVEREERAGGIKAARSCAPAEGRVTGRGDGHGSTAKARPRNTVIGMKGMARRR